MSRLARSLLDLQALTPAELDGVRERFNEKWLRDPETGCHIWHGAKTSRGYGSFGAGSLGVRCAHRVGYLLAHGSIGAGLVLDHLCRNPSCVNPAHLEPVSHQENVDRGLHGSLHVACVRGHDLSLPRATYSNGRCARCHTIYQRESRHRLRAGEREVTP